MFDCHEEFSQEQLARIKKIIQTDDFREINAIVHACDLDQDEEIIIKNIKDYIWIYLSHRFSNIFHQQTDDFLFFVENYQNIRTPRVLSP